MSSDNMLARVKIFYLIMLMKIAVLISISPAEWPLGNLLKEAMLIDSLHIHCVGV